jgi:hypothetical protein
MKRSKSAKVNKTYDELVQTDPKTPEEQRKAELERFLAAGGIIYKSQKGRAKGGMTKAKIKENNEKVAEKLKGKVNE